MIQQWECSNEASNFNTIRQLLNHCGFECDEYLHFWNLDLKLFTGGEGVGGAYPHTPYDNSMFK